MRTEEVKAEDLKIIVLGGDALPWRGKDDDWRGSSNRKGKGRLEEASVVCSGLSDYYVAFITCSHLSRRIKEEDVDCRG